MSLQNNNARRDPHTGLARVLSLWDATFNTVGAIIGGGIFTLLGFAAGFAGPLLPLIMFLNGIVAFMTVLVYAELGSSFRDAGGGYLWIRKALGPRIGHLSGWFSWFAHSVACGVYALSLGFYTDVILLEILLPKIGITFGDEAFIHRVIALFAIIFLSLVNYRGVSTTEKLGTVIVLIEVLTILIFVGLGVATIFFGPSSEVSNISPLMPYGVGGLLAGMGIIYLAFQGSEITAQHAEELRNPKQDLPRAIFISFGIVLVIYLLVSLIVVIGPKAPVPAWQMLEHAGEAALVEATRYFVLPHIGVPIVLLGGVLAAFAALNATIFSSSRVFYALGKAQSIPQWMARPHPKYKTPYIGVIASAILIIGMTILLPLKDIAAVADILFITLFFLVHWAFLRMRRSFPDIERPFIVPFHPLPSVIAMVSYAVLLIQLFHVSPWGVTITVIWLVGGLIIYEGYAEVKEEEDISAHMVSELRENFCDPNDENLSHYRILVPIFSPYNWQDVLPYIVALGKAQHSKIAVMIMIEFPPNAPILVGERERQQFVALQQEIGHAVREHAIDYDIFPETTQSSVDTVLSIVRKENSDLLLVPWSAFKALKRGFSAESLNRVLRETNCDLVVYKVHFRRNIQKILLPFTRSPHNELLGSIARSIATFYNVETSALHVWEDGVQDEQELREILELIFGEHPPELHLICRKGQTVSTILEVAKEHDLVLLGAAKEGAFRAIQFGPTAEEILKTAETPVFVCYHHKALFEPIMHPIEEWLKRIIRRFQQTSS